MKITTISFIIHFIKKRLVFILFLSCFQVLMAQTAVFNNTGAGYWTVPCDVTSITVEAWGGGGAGGGSSAKNAKGGGGGGGGAYVRSTISVVPGTVVSFMVGSGGVGSASKGEDGIGTWFLDSSVLFASGGSGGEAPNNGTVAGGATLPGSKGDVVISGVNGGGGSSTASGIGGAGGNFGGIGGAGGATTGNGGNGGNGNSPGGGGGGAFVGNNTTRSGGAGGNGQIRITYSSKYCTKIFNTNVFPITQVRFAGINNSTSNTVNGSSSTEYFCSSAASVEQGGIYPIAVKGNTNGNNTHAFRVYVDWDQNGVYGNQANEIYNLGTLVNSTGVDAKEVTGSISVPATAVAGSTMMRIVKSDSSAYTDACSVSSGGQAEDYSVVVSIPSCSGTPASGSTVLSATTGNPNSIFTASVSGSGSSSAYTYQWEKSSDGIQWVSIAGATSQTATLTAESVATTYYYRRITTCISSGLSSASAGSTYTTTALTYCTPVFNTNNIGKMYIRSIKYIGVLNDDFQTANISTQSGTNGVYQDFTTLTPVAEQVRGSVVNIEALCTGSSSSGGKVGWGYWMAWVDWNRDGIFSSTEVVYSLQDYSTPSVTFGFVVDAGRPLGDYRIRIAVMNAKSTDPCGLSSAYGEMEDYLFRVVEDNNAKLDTTKPNLFSRCDAGVVSMTVYGKDSQAVNFNWYDQKYGGNLLYSGATYAPNLSATQTFYVSVVDTQGKETPFRYPIIGRIDPAPKVYFTPTPETICGEDDPYLLLSVWGDNREVVLMDEKFDSGLGNFSNNHIEDIYHGSNTTPYSYDWSVKSSPLEQKKPPHEAIASSISSGYFGGDFVIMNSDGADRINKTILRHLVSNSTFDTTPFLANKIKLDFNIYYFSISEIATEAYVKVQYSEDGVVWKDVTTFLKNQGNPLFWNEVSLDLDALGVPRSSNLHLRFSLYSVGFSSGYFENVVSLDNIKLHGSVPIDRDYEWSGIDSGVLYDETCTTPLGNSLARRVCVKPPLDEFEKPYWTLHASATFQNGCPATGSTVVYNDTKIWNQPGKKDWNIANDWKPVGVPDIKKCVIARTPVELPSDVDLGTNTQGLARSVIVKSGGQLTVSPTSSLTIQNYIKNEANVSDVVVESDANLLQRNNDAVNIGNITVRRNAHLKRLDYNYWGSPVVGQNVRAFSPGTLESRFYVYNESNDYFDGLFIHNLYPDDVTPSQTPTVDKNTYQFIIGKGYCIRAANNLGNTLETVVGEFKGVPFNGLLDVPLVKTGGGYNLISNPYPSNIDFYALYGYQSNSSLIYNTAYFWTNTNFNPRMQGSKYPSNLASGQQIINNYAVLNGTGGLAAPYGFIGSGNNDVVGSPSNCPSCAVPTQNIKPGQGFIVKAKSNGQLQFENGANIRNSNPDSIFFNRMSSVAKVEKDRFWLNLRTPLDFISPILIGYVEGATDDYEQDYDGELMVVGGDSFYTTLGNKKLGIQGKKAPFKNNDAVALGAKFGIEGNYEIFISKKEGVFAVDQDIYLMDRLLKKTINLSQGAYQFTAVPGMQDDRFVILYKPKKNYNAASYTQSLGLNSVNEGIKTLQVYQIHDYIVVDSPEIIKRVRVFDASGKMMYQSNYQENKVSIHSTSFIKGVYILEIETSKGVEVKKIQK